MGNCASLKEGNEDIESGLYTLFIPGVNNDEPFTGYCDFTMDDGIGYLVVFNRYFGGYEAGPSTSEMATTNVPDVGDGVSSEYILSISNIFSSYNDGAGASRMIVYATSGHSTGIESASTYRWVRFDMDTDQMTRCWNGDTGTRSGFNFVTSDGHTGSSNILSGHGTGGCVYQWSANGGEVNNYLTFEYCPSQGSDPNHYWQVGTGQSGSTYYRVDSMYGSSGALYNRWGGIAIY